MLSVDLDAGFAAIGAAVVLVHADVLFSPRASGSVAVFFGDADVLTRVAVVSTRWGGLR